MKNEIKSIWEDRWNKGYILAETYEEYKSRMGPIMKDLLHELKITIDKLEVKNKKIIDIGGGYGASLKFLFDGSNEKYLVDISQNAIDFAKKNYAIKNAYSLDFIEQELPIDEYFDFVLCSELIEHIYPLKIEVLIRKIHQILKPNGILVITTPNLVSLTSRIRILLGKKPLIFVLDQTHISAFTVRDFSNLLIKAKFKEVYQRTTKARILINNLMIKFPFRINLGEHIIGVWTK